MRPTKVSSILAAGDSAPRVQLSFILPIFSGLKSSGIEADHQTSNFDKWVLSKFGPKGRYASSAEVPSYVRKMEMDNAKSRGRIVLNLLMMAATLAASFYLLGVGRVRRDAGQTLSNRNMEMHKSWSQEGKQDASKN